jgi:hypothetical protein
MYVKNSRHWFTYYISQSVYLDLSRLRFAKSKSKTLEVSFLVNCFDSVTKRVNKNQKSNLSSFNNLPRLWLRISKCRDFDLISQSLGTSERLASGVVSHRFQNDSLWRSWNNMHVNDWQRKCVSEKSSSKTLKQLCKKIHVCRLKSFWKVQTLKAFTFWQRQQHLTSSICCYVQSRQRSVQYCVDICSPMSCWEHVASYFYKLYNLSNWCPETIWRT